MLFADLVDTVIFGHSITYWSFLIVIVVGVPCYLLMKVFGEAASSKAGQALAKGFFSGLFR